METDKLRSIRDSLTGFHSRDVLAEYLHNQIITAKAQNKTFALLIIDIDFFKSINDKYGHLAGDEALKFFAGILNEALKGEYFVARYGGDEFMVVMANCGQKEAIELSRLIKNLLNTRFFIYKERTFLLKASMGIAIFPLDADEREELIKKSDGALYYAKRHGRNKITLASKVKYLYPKVKYLNLAIIIAIGAIVVFLFLKANQLKPIDLQATYSKIIIKANFLVHKAVYKYNYCSLELDNQERIEGWVIKEDKDRIYISRKIPDVNVKIMEIPRKRIRIYFKIIK